MLATQAKQSTQLPTSQEVWAQNAHRPAHNRGTCRPQAAQDPPAARRRRWQRRQVRAEVSLYSPHMSQTVRRRRCRW
jgi:hypothetical protein